MKLKLTTITTIILAALIAIITIVFSAYYLESLAKQAQYLERIEEQQERYLGNIQEWTDNYNELYASYKETEANYWRLYVNLSTEGWQEFECTGYSSNDISQGTNNTTASGFKCDSGLPIVAVDPDIVPLYSIVEIEGLGAFVALDTGGLIKGNRLDVLFDSKEEALRFGRQNLYVRVIE